MTDTRPLPIASGRPGGRVQRCGTRLRLTRRDLDGARPTFMPSDCKSEAIGRESEAVDLNLAAADFKSEGTGLNSEGTDFNSWRGIET